MRRFMSPALLMGMFSRFLEWLRDDAPADDPDEREAFVLRLRALVQTIDPSLGFDATDEAFVGPEGSRSYLGNHWDRYRSSPAEEHEAVLLDTARIIVSLGTEAPRSPTSWAEAAPRVRPRLRPRHMYEVVGLQSALRAPHAPRDAMATLRPLRGDLHVELAYDLPTSIQNLQPSTLAEWGIETDDAYDRALVNLGQNTPPRAFYRLEGEVFTVSVGDCYDSSRLLLVDQIRALPLQGRPVALPANRDALFIVGEHDTTGLDTLLRLAAQALDQPLPLVK